MMQRKKIYQPKNKCYIEAIKRLYKKGEVTLEQYASCLRKYQELEKNNDEVPLIYEKIKQ